jgi:integrase
LTDGLVDTRDRAVLLLAFTSGGRRRSEVANLRVDDLLIRTDATTHATPQRRARLKIRMSIGDAASRDEMTITGKPAQALLCWIESAGIVSGPVFRKVDQWGNVSRRMLTPQSINLIVKARAEKAGLDPQLVSAHGLRTGYRMDNAKRDGPNRQSKQQKKPILKDLGPKPAVNAAS